MPALATAAVGTSATIAVTGAADERAAAAEAQEVGAQVVGALVAVLGVLGERGR